MVARLSKLLMVVCLAAFTLIAMFDNITEYDTNFQFVRHVLRMNTTFAGNALLYRSSLEGAIGQRQGTSEEAFEAVARHVQASEAGQDLAEGDEAGQLQPWASGTIPAPTYPQRSAAKEGGTCCESHVQPSTTGVHQAQRAQGSPVQLLDGLERTTRMPTSSPTTRHHTITTTQPFHVQWVGNAGGELLSY